MCWCAVKKLLTHSLTVLSHLDYRNAVLAGLPTSTLAPFQWVHTVARTVLDLKPRDHVTPSLHELHWLPVAERIQYKCLLVHKSRKNTSLTFWLLIAKIPGRSTLCALLRGNLIMLWTCWWIGNRASCVAAPRAWTGSQRSWNFAIDGLVLLWTENISVWFYLRAPGYGPTLWWALGLLVGGAIQVPQLQLQVVPKIYWHIFSGHTVIIFITTVSVFVWLEGLTRLSYIMGHFSLQHYTAVMSTSCSAVFVSILKHFPYVLKLCAHKFAELVQRLQLTVIACCSVNVANLYVHKNSGGNQSIA